VTAESNNETNVVDPNKWIHLVKVIGTVVVAFSMIMIGLPISKLAHFEINEMAAARFSPSWPKVALFLGLTVLYFLVIYLSQRFVHKAPFRTLGFKDAMIRQALVAFLIGATINLIPFLVTILTAQNMAYESSVPDGTPLLRVAAAYAYFFFIFLTVNSIGEELVFRCYPIEHFQESPRTLSFVIVLFAVLFALLHFIVREPSWRGFFMLSLTSIFYSLIYLNWRSIWVLVGIHNGMNFVNLTFSENWEMGGLFTWNGDGMVGLSVYLDIYRYAVPVVGIAILFILFRRSLGSPDESPETHSP
jgi:membrane protease YdiL (CAAX protease family)